MLVYVITWIRYMIVLCAAVAQVLKYKVDYDTAQDIVCVHLNVTRSQEICAVVAHIDLYNAIQ